MNTLMNTIAIVCSLAFTASYAKNKSIYSMKSNKVKSPEELVGPIREDERFLKAISMIESSGGKDLDHSTMESGIHAGDTAVGELGLMPNTVREIAGRIKNRDRRLQLDPSFQGDPEIEQYTDPNIDQATLQYAMQSSPELMQRVGRYMQKLVESRYKDPEKMAYAWNMGHNQDPSKITQEKLDKSPYVQKNRRFIKLQEAMNRPSKITIP